MSKSNQRHWKRHDASQQPPPRYAACLAFDARQGLGLLFGGGALNDTWVWNGISWSEKQPEHSPPARTRAALAYDTQRQRLALFGGQALNSRVGKLLDDTWTWDGSNWQINTVAISPAARLGANLAYDAGRQHVLLFGGTNGQQTFDDTWTWDGQVWTRQTITGQRPPARAWANLAYDLSANLMVLTSGSNSSTPLLGDSWTWDGSLWKQIPTNGLPPGPYQSMTYDAARQALVVYAVSGSKAKSDITTYKSFQANTARPPLNSETWVWVL